MSTPIRELPGHSTLKAWRQLEWRFQTLKEDYQEASSYGEPKLDMHSHTFQYSRRDQIYEAEKLLHHYLSGYYTYWRQVMTVGHATDDMECKGRIKSKRDSHDKKPSSRITRGLRMYVQKENVLPIMLYQSDHEEDTPKYAISLEDVKRSGLYDPSFEHYFNSVDGICIFPYDVIEDNWSELESLHKSVESLLKEHMEIELKEYRDRLQDLEDVSDDLPLSEFMKALLPSEDPMGDSLFTDF